MSHVADPIAHPGAGPVFVVGTMRSGSTLLRLILDSHESISIGPETGFMGAVSATRSIPGFKYGDVWFERIGWTRAELDLRLRELVAPMFQRHAADQGKPRWGEKTPFHTWHIPAMAEVFPDAVFVAIVRHPAAVATSLRDRFHYTFGDALTYWDDTNRELLRQARLLGSRLVLCRYEELVLDTEAVMRPMLAWLGEPWSDAVLSHHEVQEERGSPRMSDGSTITRDSVDPGRASSWAAFLGREDRADLQRVQPVAGLLGYELSSPVTSADPRHLLEDGSALVRRLDSAGLDLGTRTAVVEPDADPADLARRLLAAEAALARIRRRRIVRLGDALRRVQRNRSMHDVREAVRVLREGPRRS